MPLFRRLFHTRARALAVTLILATAPIVACSQLTPPLPPHSAPHPWRSASWDVTVHSRDRETWSQLEPTAAHHGHGCEAPPASHQVSDYDAAVFECRGHVMTAINASGYGVVYLTPNRTLDFSRGPATLSFDLSTQRSSTRDWVDLWLTPYSDNLQLALDEWLPDGNGHPRNAIHIRMNSFVPEGGSLQTVFTVAVIRDFVRETVAGDTWTGYETFLSPSASRRDRFALEVSSTHLKFGLPDHHFSWVDAQIPDLGWSQAVVQLGHHSYSPTKDCDPRPLVAHRATACTANTWHWSAVSLSPSREFTLIPAQQRALAPDTPGSALEFARPAPAGAHIRFTAIGQDVELSPDGGQTWRPATPQASSVAPASDRFRAYWTPVPPGTRSVHIRARNWWGGRSLVRDASIWAPQAGSLSERGTRLAPHTWPLVGHLVRLLPLPSLRATAACERDLLRCP